MGYLGNLSAAPAEQRGRFNELQLMAFVSERIAHSIRAPLSLLLETSKQLEQGVQIDCSQAEECRSAVLDLRQLAELLSFFSVPVKYNLERLDVSKLIIQHFPDTPLARYSGSGDSFVLPMNEALTVRMLQAVAIYLSRLRDFSGSSEQQTKMVIELWSNAKDISLSMILQGLSEEFTERLPASQSLKEVAYLQHMPESLCVWYAAQAAELQGGTAVFERRGRSALAVFLLFPHNLRK